MKEPQLVLKAKKALIAEGHCVIKIHGGQYSVGVSDLLVCAKSYTYGYFVALEFKLPGKERRVTPLQSKFIRDVRAAGGIAWVVSSVEAALEVCRDLPTPRKGELVYECKPET